MFSMGAEAAALCREQKLAGLYRIIPARKIEQAISQCHPHRQVFRWMGTRGKGAAPGRSTLCMARQRLGVKPLVKLAQATVRLLGNAATSPRGVPSQYACDGNRWVCRRPPRFQGQSDFRLRPGRTHPGRLSPGPHRGVVRGGRACAVAVVDQAHHLRRDEDGRSSAEASAAQYAAAVGSRLSLATHA